MVDLVMDVEMWSMDGAILSDLASGALDELKIFPLQAYMQAHNVLVPDLDIWIGARLYRKQDIHICDYFDFNNLPSQGFGAMYKGLDTAVLITTGSSPFYQVDMNAGQPMPNTPDMVRRLRTMLVAQYALPIGLRSSFVQALGELHVVPKSSKGDVDSAAQRQSFRLRLGRRRQAASRFGRREFQLDCPFVMAHVSPTAPPADVRPTTPSGCRRSMERTTAQ